MVDPESNATPPEDRDYKQPGPFRIEGRDFLLAAVLTGMMVMKTAIAYGFGDAFWVRFAIGAALVWGLSPTIAWIAWKRTGGRPFWGEIGYIATATAVFVAYSIPIYASIGER